MAYPAILELNNISFSYPGAARPVFTDVSVSFPRGWTAVLGDNGIGKTTLMRIVTGDLPPSSGSIAPNPANLVSAYCEQRIDSPPRNLDDFASDWSPETIAMRRLLDIGDDWPYRYATLSGGEMKRLQIACALSTRPDLVVLDEPTNHVDEPTRSAIVATLRAYPGIGVIISHDPELIDALCGRCLWFLRRHVKGVNVTVVEAHPGNYTQGMVQITNADSSDRLALKRARDERTRLQARRSQRFQAVQHAEALKQKEGFRIDPRDHDALNRHKGAKSGSVDGHSAHAYARMASQVDRAERRVDAVTVSAKRYDGDIWFHDDCSAHEELARLEAGIIMFGDDQVLSGDAVHDAAAQSHTTMPLNSGGARNTRASQACDAYSILRVDGQRCGTENLGTEHRSTRSDGAQDTSTSNGGAGNGGDHSECVRDDRSGRPVGLRIPLLSVGPRDHIGLSGPNGLGKTALINTVLRTVADVPSLVIGQTLPSHAGARALERLRGLRSESRSRVMNAYAQLNSDPDRLLNEQGGEQPSPGELRKLLLCLGIVDKPQLIIMDEPTNHLDLGSKRALSQALRDFSGAVMVVSHEQWFLDATTDIHWTVAYR